MLDFRGASCPSAISGRLRRAAHCCTGRRVRFEPGGSLGKPHLGPMRLYTRLPVLLLVALVPAALSGESDEPQQNKRSPLNDALRVADVEVVERLMDMNHKPVRGRRVRQPTALPHRQPVGPPPHHTTAPPPPRHRLATPPPHLEPSPGTHARQHGAHSPDVLRYGPSSEARRRASERGRP